MNTVKAKFNAVFPRYGLSSSQAIPQQLFDCLKSFSSIGAENAVRRGLAFFCCRSKDTQNHPVGHVYPSKIGLTFSTLSKGGVS